MGSFKKERERTSNPQSGNSVWFRWSRCWLQVEAITLDVPGWAIQRNKKRSELGLWALWARSKGRRREVNRDFERFELSQKEEEEKGIRTLSALSSVQRKRSKRSNGRWAFRTWSNHYYGEASSASAPHWRSSIAFGSSCIVSMKGKRDLCEVHCIIDKVLWQVAQFWCCTCRLKIFR